MGTVVEKLQYTANAIDDIQNALVEKGVEVTSADELATYGDKIRGFSSMKVYSRYVDITAGVWTGASLSDDSWVALCNASYDSKWTYYFDTEMDISKIKFISASFIEKTNYLRIPKGYASNSSTAQYQYTPVLGIFGSAVVDSSNQYAGGISKGTSVVSATIQFDDYSGAASNSKIVYVTINVYSNRIEFVFNYVDRVFAHIKSKKPYFSFAIGYES